MTTPADVWSKLDPLVPIYERDGDNYAPPITPWYYGWHAAWCAMTVSWGWAHAGFSDDGGDTLNLHRLIGITQTTAKGWAYCPYLEDAFRTAGRWHSEPAEGDAFITAGQTHTGLVWRVNDDGTVNTVEGNYGNSLTYARRTIGSLRGFCRPPYDGHSTGIVVPAGPIPPFPGFIRRGMKGEHVKQVQERLIAHGHNLGRWGADGDFGKITHDRMKVHQKAWNLKDDGVVGPITWPTLWVNLP